MKTDSLTYKLVLLLLVFFLSGCTTKEKGPEEKVFTDFEKWRKLAEYTEANSPSPRDIDTKQYEKKTSSQHLAEIKDPENKTEKQQVELPKRKLPVIKVSLQMHDVDVGVLFRTLAKAADVNIILNKSISGKASLNINDVPWNQVFTSLLSTYGYTYDWMGDIIRIVSIEDLNKEASLIDAKQMMELKKREHDIALLSLDSEKEQLEPLITRVVHVDYSEPTQLRDNLWEFLSVSKSGYQNSSEKSEQPGQGKIRGSILVDTHTNSLMIQATANDMISVLELMEELDKPTPQVRIEAFIVETNGETARQLGMQWGGLFKTANGFTKIISGPDFEDIGDSIDDLLLPDGGLKLGNVTGVLGKYILNVQLKALQEDGKLNILSSPSITTLDNQKAIIESGREIPYTARNEGENSVEFKKAVLRLVATPHVIDANNLKIKIQTNKDEVDFSNDVDGNPVLLTKYAETEVVLLDGQTTVIGGLGKETHTQGESGIPGAKDIPVLGYAFKQEEKRILMEDILIFITPYILKQKDPDNGETAGTDDQDLEYRFSLQVGVFANKQNADRLLGMLAEKGYSPYLFETVNSKNENLYSVRLKDFMDLKSAYEAEYEYRKKENKPAVVAFYNMLDTVPEEIRKY